MEQLKTVESINELTKIAPKTVKDFTDQLDFFFKLYLKEYNIQNSLASKIVKEKWWISSMIKEIFWYEFNWESDEKIDIHNLEFFLFYLSKFLNKIYTNHPELKDILKEWLWTKEWIAGKEFFNNPSVDVNEIYLIELFFKEFLVSKWIKNTSEYNNEIIKKDSQESFKILVNDLIETVVFIKWKNNNVEWWSDLIQLLLLLKTKYHQLNLEKIEDFIENINNSFEIFSKTEFEEKIIIFVLEQIKKFFPEIYWRELILYNIEAVLLWRWKPEKSYLLDKQNFYFKRQNEKKTGEMDQFPRNWKHLKESKNDEIFKDINIYDIYWKKVYWWDITKRHFSKLTWTYFILTENDAIDNIPKFAKTNVRVLCKDKKTTQHENITTAYIDTDYMRIKAIWKIQNWEYIKNVFGPELE